MCGWIKLHRSLLDWEWYGDINTKVVFIHLLLIANHKDNKWRGIEIKRGQRLTSISGLAKETGLSVKNIRTAIKHLKKTNEVASHSTAQHTVFTVVNYDLYQEKASEPANKGQAGGKQGATNKNDKNEKNEKKTNAAPLDVFSAEVFQKWWVHLPSKRKVDKKKSERLWLAATKNKSADEVRLMANGICDYIEDKTGEDGKGEFMKHPERFIKAEVWNMYQQQELE